jgi:hypothetical protein
VQKLSRNRGRGRGAGGGSSPAPLAYVLPADGASYTLTGNSASLVPSGAPKTLGAAIGAFTVTGQAATLKVGRRVQAVTGAYTVTGQAANLYYVGPPPQWLLANGRWDDTGRWEDTAQWID